MATVEVPSGRIRRAELRAAIAACAASARFVVATACLVAAAATGGAVAAEAPWRGNSTDLAVRTAPGDRVLEFDWPALHIGIAEYPDGPTGTTVLHIPAGAAMALDVRGGSPGVVGDYSFVHAIVLSGGSLLGLEAAAGVAGLLLARNRNIARWDTIPLVSGGVVFDFGGRTNGIHPDKRLGRAALRSAVSGRFPLGARGAGRFVTVGKGLDYTRGDAAGQGAAFRADGELRIFACTVLNAVGAVFDRQGRRVRGYLDQVERLPPAAEPLQEATPRIAAQDRGDALAARSVGRNTTLTVVVVNQTVRGFDLVQLGRQLHASMARAIHPFHTRDDGDALWMVSTAEVELPQWSVARLGIAASEVLWDAVLAARP